MRDGCDVSPHFWNGLVKEHIRIPDLTLVVGTDPAPLHFLRSNKGMVRLVREGVLQRRIASSFWCVGGAPYEA